MSFTMNQNIPNGMPAHMNGVGSGSSHSSRDSSPASGMFPARQIPASQLPPSKQPPNISHLTQNYANLNINTAMSPVPNLSAHHQQQQQQQQQFKTSTPGGSAGTKPMDHTLNQSAVLSPIPSTGFTHSATSNFSQVPLANAKNESNTLQQQAQVPSQKASAQNVVPSAGGGPFKQNGSNSPRLPHQNSLPNSQPQQPVKVLQPSLSQPRFPQFNNMPAVLNNGSQQQQQQPQQPPVVKQQQMPFLGQQTNSLPPQSVANRMPDRPPLSGPPPANHQNVPNNNLQNYPPLQAQMSQPNLYQPQQQQQQQQQQNQRQNMFPKSNSTEGPYLSTAPKTTLHANRYPQQFNNAPAPIPQNYPANSMAQNAYQNNYAPQLQQQQQQQQLPQQFQQQQNNYQTYQQLNQPPSNNYQQSAVNRGFNRMWGADNVDLLQTVNILPDRKVEVPKISLGNPALDEANCSGDVFRCTLTKIPESNALLQKSRLPLGVLIHPFRDLNHLPVIQCNTIVRCRACRTYINPFVFFVDNKRWKCNLCYRVNELPEEFQYDPITKTYGDPSRRPEIKNATIEYIAPAEYMLRPPQPAVYLFLLDISRAAIESGYLQTVCSTLAEELSNLPGDSRTHIGFIAYDSALHFYSLAEGLNQPHEMIVLDIDEVFLPCPENLLVNLQDRLDLVGDLLTQLPNRYDNSYDTGSALGAALQAAHKMMASTGGRVTVFQSSLPSLGPGALTSREDPCNRASGDVKHLNPANDFYKRLALECSGQQIAVDMFIVNSQYVDMATITGISRFSGGCIYHFPLFKASRPLQNQAFDRSLRRYLTRKIGFEAVMRVRCTRGLSIHTFHGNLFVRSTDLLSLPNVNPDAGFGMQIAIEESLSDVQTVCFQAALLYTSSKGERRIRVHTICLPVVSTLSDVINSADQQCVVGLLSKMAVDRSMQSNLGDAREAFINAAIDVLSSYKLAQNIGGGSGLLAPKCLSLLPLYISAMLKTPAFRTGVSTRLDDRVKAMCDMKSKPLQVLIQQIYPDLYAVHNLQDYETVQNDDGEPVHLPPLLQLSARSIDSNGAYLLDTEDHMVLVVCPAVSSVFLNQVLGVADYNSISDSLYELPLLHNEHNTRLHMFINYLNDEKPTSATLQIIRENSPLRGLLLEKLVEDRIESALSYHEFLQHIKAQLK